MGLTENQKQLIQALSLDNIQKSKELAIACLNEDTTQKNRQFCKRYRQILEGSARRYIELPQELQNLMYEEITESSFNEDRYYLSNREESLLERILKINKASEHMTAMQIHYLNSVLLHGETGTGKTLFGKYVAYKLKLPFCYINISNIIDSYMGHTSKNITRVFDYISGHQCVFMIDEIDGISNKRKSSNSSGVDGELSRTTLAIMQELDRLSNNAIVIAATNRIDRLDDALLRRFSIIHEVKRFSDPENRRMIEKCIDDIGLKIDEKEIDMILSDHPVQSRAMQMLIEHIAGQVINNIDTSDISGIRESSYDNANDNITLDDDSEHSYIFHHTWRRDANSVYRCSRCGSKAKSIPLTTYCPDCGEKLSGHKR